MVASCLVAPVTVLGVIADGPTVLPSSERSVSLHPFFLVYAEYPGEQTALYKDFLVDVSPYFIILIFILHFSYYKRRNEGYVFVMSLLN